MVLSVLEFPFGSSLDFTSLQGFPVFIYWDHVFLLFFEHIYNNCFEVFAKYNIWVL